MNFILRTDSYKLTHWDMYPVGTTCVYSYLEARKGGTYGKTKWFGLQYYLKRSAGHRESLELGGDPFLQWAGSRLAAHAQSSAQLIPPRFGLSQRRLCLGAALPSALQAGDLLTAGFRSNYRPEVVMNHIYFTALRDGAGLAAELAAGEGAPRVYAVEPTGAFEDDPNVTDKKFPGNPTRSYRSTEPIRVVGEVEDWPRLAPEALQAWRDRLQVILEEERGEIIN